MIIATGAKPDPGGQGPPREGCRSEQVPSVSDLARSEDICGEGYSIQRMLQFRTPPIDRSRASEPMDSASLREIHGSIILRRALQILLIRRKTRGFFRRLILLAVQNSNFECVSKFGKMQFRRLGLHFCVDSP